MTTCIEREHVIYTSAIDGLTPLHADVVFRPDGIAKPMALVLHGFHCRRQSVAADCDALAAAGVFCVAPDMRGHGDSAGAHDCGALQLCDAVDALREAAAACPAECDPARISALGYSGGGGNVLGLLTKFPDLLQAGAAFFGISDYALWHATRGRPDCNATMERALGGTPAEVPLRYAARSSLAAVVNNPRTRLHLFWDAEERDCPPVLNERFVEAAGSLGHTNVTAHVSRPGDATRWRHGYRSGVPDLDEADRLFLPDFLASARDVSLPPRGELHVCGFMVTRRFAVWIGAGTEGWARVRYDLTGERPRVTVMAHAGPPVWVETKPERP